MVVVKTISSFLPLSPLYKTCYDYSRNGKLDASKQIHTYQNTYQKKVNVGKDPLNLADVKSFQQNVPRLNIFIYPGTGQLRNTKFGALLSLMSSY